MVLKHHRTLWPRRIHLMAIQHTATLGGLKQASHNVQDGGLATAGVANQGNKLALLYLQINVVQGHKRSLRRIKRHFNTG